MIMNIQQQDGVLSITGLRELGAANAHSFRDEACAALPQRLKAIEIDLSHTSFVDSYGLGALVSLYKFANGHNNDEGVVVRLLNPPAPVQQVFELTRMHHLFEIVKRVVESPEPTPSPRPRRATVVTS
jgi:anti-sigma B factor antagonist